MNAAPSVDPRHAAPADAPRAGVRRQIYRVLCTALAIAFIGYFFWGIYSERGLMGWLLDLQMHWLGSASLKAAGLIVSFVLVVGYFVLVMLLHSVMRVGGVDPVLAMAGVRDPQDVLNPPSPAAPAPAGSVIKPLLWAALVVPLLTWSVAYAIYAYASKQQAVLAATVPPTLPVAAPNLAEQLKRPVRLEAVPLLDKALVFKSNKAQSPSHYYIPLAADAAAPVTAVLHIESRTQPARAQVMGPYVVQRSRSGVPEYVSAQLQRDGSRFAGDVLLVEPVPVAGDGSLRDRREEYWMNFLIAAGIGLVCGVAILAAAAGIWRVERKARREAAAAK